MNERFDSWQGFLDAGFVAKDDGSLCLGDATASFSATKAAGEIRVRFSVGLSGCEDVEFNLPSTFDDMWEWAAEIASRTFGSRQTWDDIRKKFRGRMNPDLEQMIGIGIDHLDEIEANVANAPDEDSDIEDGATEDGTLDELEEDGTGCAPSEDWSSCLREIVKNEVRDFCSRGYRDRVKKKAPRQTSQNAARASGLGWIPNWPRRQMVFPDALQE